MSRAGFETETLTWLARAAVRAMPPRVQALHPPPARPGDDLAGESCALQLEDGSQGLSCMLFGDALPALRAAALALAGADALALAAGCAAPAAAHTGLERPLGLAAVNALTGWLFARGVDAIGGSWVVDAPAFLEALRAGAPRGASTRKFEIDATTYPGAGVLLSRR